MWLCVNESVGAKVSLEEEESVTPTWLLVIPSHFGVTTA